MFRTSCFGCRPDWASTWTSLTSPSGVVTTRADRIPSRLVSRFSARRTPHGSGTESGGGAGRPTWLTGPDWRGEYDPLTICVLARTGLTCLGPGQATRLRPDAFAR